MSKLGNQRETLVVKSEKPVKKRSLKEKKKKPKDEEIKSEEEHDGKVQIWVKKSELKYEKELKNLQVELLKFQNHVKDQGLKSPYFSRRSTQQEKVERLNASPNTLILQRCKSCCFFKPSDTERTQ